MCNYDDLVNVMNTANKNTLIIGPAGCGKSNLIHRLMKMRDDIIAVAPSGIAAENIGGSTIHSFFRIRPGTYTVKHNMALPRNERIRNLLKTANILLIDEVSMLRCELIDIVDQKLRLVRKSREPFGGLRLIFLGDPCQMEPVVKDDNERGLLKSLYPCAGPSFSFYDASVMTQDNYFDRTFDFYELNHDFRHQEDPVFRDMLLIMRQGAITGKSLSYLNRYYIPKHNVILGPEVQYLTVTNMRASIYNKIFIAGLRGKLFASEAVLPGCYSRDVGKMIRPFHQTLFIKDGMKIMFIVNGDRENGQPWVNGTQGKIVNITTCGQRVVSVLINIDGNPEQKSVEVCPGEYPVNMPAYTDEDGVRNASPKIVQFPFVPSYAITIDKSQGLTLDNIAVVMEDRPNKPNQIYVALSRAKKLSEVVILEREIKPNDIKQSLGAKLIYGRIAGKLNYVSNIVNTSDRQERQ